MSKKIIVFVGKPYNEFIKWILSNNYDVICLTEKGTNYSFPDGILRNQVANFSEKVLFLEDIKQIKEENIVGFVATYENAILPKSWATQAFGLPGLPEKSALFATDKFLMRQQFQSKCPQISPSFREVKNWEDVEDFMHSHPFPVMLKPTNLFKSLLVTKNDSAQELRDNFQQTMENLQRIYIKEGVRRVPSLLIEEYMEGKSYSVEVFADSDGNTIAIPPVDLVMGRDLGIQDNFNYSRTLPSILDESDHHLLMQTAREGVEALEFRSSPAHVELIWTTQGPKIIEIGARVGGYRPRMYQLAHGIDLFDAQVELSQGEIPNLSVKKQEYCCVYELFSQSEGNFNRIKDWDLVLSLPSKYYSVTKTKEGEKTGLSRDGYRAVAIVILASSSLPQLLSDRKLIEERVQVEVC